MELERELVRTSPDYVGYKPGSIDGSTFDTGNEHFLVFDAPDGSLMAVWTQSSYEEQEITGSFFPALQMKAEHGSPLAGSQARQGQGKA